MPPLRGNQKPSFEKIPKIRGIRVIRGIRDSDSDKRPGSETAPGFSIKLTQLFVNLHETSPTMGNGKRRGTGTSPNSTSLACQNGEAQGPRRTALLWRVGGEAQGPRRTALLWRVRKRRGTGTFSGVSENGEAQGPRNSLLWRKTARHRDLAEQLFSGVSENGEAQGPRRTALLWRAQKWYSSGAYNTLLLQCFYFSYELFDFSLLVAILS